MSQATSLRERKPGIACIFDMDGTLVDSEPVYEEADRLFLAAYGIDARLDSRDSMIGAGNLEFFLFQERNHPESPLNALPMEERLRLKDECYLEYARGRTYAFSPMLRFLSLLRERGYPLAVASGSSPEIIGKSLEFAGILDAFPVLVSALEVPRGKPEPDVFVEAARRLGRRPGECVVFEDSQYGVRAALAAGMRVVGIPSPLSGPLPEPFRRADLLFPGGMAAFDPLEALRFIEGG